MSDMVRLSLISLLLLGLPACQGPSPDQGDKQKTAAPQADAGPAKPAVPAGQPDYSRAGQTIPALGYETRDGKRQTLAPDPKGRITLVNLWATWCAPCKAEMPALARLATQNSDRLRVLAISQDIGGWPLVDRFYADMKLQGLTPLLDSEALMSMQMEAPGLPLTIAYDAKGRELWRVAGERTWDDAQSHALIFGK